MNMTNPMSKSSFENLQTELHSAYTQTAQDCMKNAADEIRKTELKETYDEQTPAHVTASLDCTWQRKGFASLNGIVTTISSGKCVDYEILTKN